MSIHICLSGRLEGCYIVRSTSSSTFARALLTPCSPTASRRSCIRHEWVRLYRHQCSRSRSAIPKADAGDSLSAMLAETAALDQLIDLLMNAKSPQEVGHSSSVHVEQVYNKCTCIQLRAASEVHPHLILASIVLTWYDLLDPYAS